MILDTIDNAGRYYGLHKDFLKAFSFMTRQDLRSLRTGRHEIAGDRVFAIISKGPGRRKQDAQLEIHDKYIDIQYVIEGCDEMGWKPRTGCRNAAGKYDPDKDIQFFTVAPDFWVLVKSGMFTIFFPDDAHLPLISDGEVHKVVVKVAVSE